MLAAGQCRLHVPQAGLAVHYVCGGDLDYQFGVYGGYGLLALHARGRHILQGPLPQDLIGIHPVLGQDGAGVVGDADQLQIEAHIPQHGLLAGQSIHHPVAHDAVAHQGYLDIPHLDRLHLYGLNDQELFFLAHLSQYGKRLLDLRLACGPDLEIGRGWLVDAGHG